MKTYKGKTYAIQEHVVYSHDGVASHFYMPLLLHDRLAAFSNENDIAKRRQNDVDTCVRFDNYFATLANMLQLIQSVDKEIGHKILHKMIEDLEYLQKNYRIVHREDSDK